MVERNVISIPDAEALEREAAHWFVRFEAGDVPEADRLAFRAWFAKSPQHRDAFDRVSAFWDASEVLEELADYAAADDVVQPLGNVRFDRRKRTARRILTGAIAASLLAIAGVGIINIAGNWGGEYSARYATAIGEQETIQLPDGSEITLNTDTALRVAYDRKARYIQLESGEAYFDVTSDPNRPFSVMTGNGVVTAIGTAFSVRIHDEKIDVLVTEGRVALAPAAQDEVVDPTISNKVTEVSAGQAIEFAQTAQTIEIVPGDEAKKALDWQDGMIAFNGETLEEVIAVLSRYTDLSIEISGDDLRQQKIVAYYRIGEIDPMFQALNLMAGVEVERRGDGQIRLYRADKEEY